VEERNGRKSIPFSTTARADRYREVPAFIPRKDGEPDTQISGDGKRLLSTP